eukprot:460187_1
MSTSEEQEEEKVKPDVDVVLSLLPEDNTAHTVLSSPSIHTANNIQIISTAKEITPQNTPPSFSNSNSSLQNIPRLNTLKAKLMHQKSTPMVNYNFGVPFSYWEEYDVYDFVKCKYKDLKEELLQNTIYKITLERYNDILEKGQELHSRIASILGQGTDKNTAFARALTNRNDYCNIKPNTLISLEH